MLGPLPEAVGSEMTEIDLKQVVTFAFVKTESQKDRLFSSS